jgi:hypothetical protein
VGYFTLTNDTKRTRSPWTYALIEAARGALPSHLDEGDEYTIWWVDAASRDGVPVEQDTYHHRGAPR